MDLTPHHSKYYSYDLTRRAASGLDRLSATLFDAAVDLNPHQIEAALFALHSPLSKGVILADEVGLGKTIEAGIVLCEFWAERRRKLLIICPASIRKQWALELQEKFNLPSVVLDAKASRDMRRNAEDPLQPGAIVIMSFNYAHALKAELRSVQWDLVVIDEAHKLRNAYRPSNKVGQGIRWATEDSRKLLLTATPLQNSLRNRLETLWDKQIHNDREFTEQLIENEEFDIEVLDEIIAGETEENPLQFPQDIDRHKLREEIETLRGLAAKARQIGTDTKSRSLLTALEIGFARMAAIGAAQKALIFTESRRTQEYLKDFLETNGYAGQVVLFNGTNNGPEATAIYDAWVDCNRDTGRVSGSRSVDVRTALIEHFRDHATIFLATEAAAEGVNLQFCSLVVNYDLPWNPQRIEQRIGRCHCYGQRYDVVVINFLNKRNEADRRVLELLTEKFNLFSGVFGASDEVLGSIESGVDFEKRILAIYQECRTPEEIDAAFRSLQAEMDEQIRTRLDDTRRLLFEHFDEDVTQRLRLRLADTQAQLDRFGQRFWALNIDTYEREEYLLFSGCTDEGVPLDQETMEKIFACSGYIVEQSVIPDSIVDRLSADATRHIQATLNRSLEQNNAYFNEAREK